MGTFADDVVRIVVTSDHDPMGLATEYNGDNNHLTAALTTEACEQNADRADITIYAPSWSEKLKLVFFGIS